MTLDPANRVSGYAADWWRLWEQKTGVQVDLRALPRAQALQRMASGEADVIDQIARNPENEQLFDFLPPYAEVTTSIHVHESIHGIVDLAALQGFRIGVVASDNCDEFLRDRGIDTLHTYDSHAALVNGALSGQVRLFCLDRHSADDLLARADAAQTFRRAIDLYQQTFHRAVRKGDEVTLTLLQQGADAITPDEDAALRRAWLTREGFDFGALARLLTRGAVLLAMLALFFGLWSYTTHRAVRHQTRQLRASEEHFRKLFENSCEAMSLIDCATGCFTAVNGAALRMLQAPSPDLLLGRRPIDFSPELQPDGERSSDKARTLLEQAERAGSARFEWQFARPDGSTFVAEMLMTAIPEQGKTLLHAVWHDISDKKQIEDELAAHHDNLENVVRERTIELGQLMLSLRHTSDEQETILNAATAGIMLIRGGRIARCNERLEEMTGYASGELSDAPYETLFSNGSCCDLSSNEVRGPLTQGQTYSIETIANKKDGSSLQVRVSSRAIDPDDIERGVVAVIDDISSHHAAMLALQKSSAEQQAIFETATSGIALIRDRRIIRGNNKLHELFGWPAGSLEGKPTAVWYPDQAAGVLGGSDEVYGPIWRGESHSREQELIRRDGSRFMARMIGNAVDTRDRSKGTVWVIDDISGERAVLEEMQRARDLAEQAGRMKSDFVANMSHEIRTPMNAIIGMTHLLMKAQPNARQLDYLQKIHASSQHLLGIIDDILDFSKIDAGKLELEHIDFDIEELFASVIALISQKAASRNLEIVTQIGPDVPPRMRGDPLRIRQILANYLSNAVKFTERGTITLRARLEQVTGNTLVLRFEVADTGIGIANDEQARLFTSFAQADASTTRKYGGTGLGLAISKQLAELMGGRTGVRSKLGQGSTFWFTAHLEATDSDAQPRHPARSWQGMRVLVVDDNEAAREVLTEMLRSMGLEAVAVDSGLAALEELRQADSRTQSYDAVLLDWKMPDMDGIETAGRIQRAGLRTPPVIVMASVHDCDDLRGRVRELGIEHVLTKPVSSSSLLDTLMRVLGIPLTTLPPDPDRSTPDFTGKHILLAEDNPLNQQVAIELLRAAGVTVETASDGQQAIDKIREGHFDAVLMDVQMPVLDGYEATRRIRMLPAARELPIIAMTANAMSGDREKCLAAGMSDYIPKPIDPSQLWEKLEVWLPSDGTFVEQAVSDAHALDALSGIASLDVATGLHHTLSRPDLYLQILHTFVLTEHDFRQRLGDALDHAQQQDALRFVHTLKGEAAQIGANTLSTQAAELERRLRIETARALSREDVEPLCSALEMLVAQLSPAIAAQPAASANTAQSSEEGRTLCDALVRLLQADDYASRDYVLQHHAALQRVLGRQLDAIENRIDEYDLPAALDILRAALPDQPAS